MATDTVPKIVTELEILLAANPAAAIRDSAGIIVARHVYQAVRRKAIEDCLAVVRRVLASSPGNLNLRVTRGVARKWWR